MVAHRFEIGDKPMHRAFIGLIAALAATSAPAQQAPLRTGVDGTFAPHAMPILSGGIQGFNVDLANEIAKRLNRRIEIEATQFSGLIPALQAGTYDFWARELADKIGWTIESFGTNTDAVQAVISGRAYANVAGNTAVAWAAKNNPAIKLSYLYSTGLVWAAPVRKDNVELRRKLDVAIECMKRDGTLAKMHEKWFGTKPAPGSAAATIYPGYGVPDMPGYDASEHPATCS